MPSDAINLLRRFVLALCVWREARGETQRGKRLVAQTVENRVVDSRWPDTYAGVIAQPLQFSSFNRGDPNALTFPTETDPSWAACVEAADAILASPEPFTTANHYHTNGVHPAWADPDKIVNREGAHVFYRL